jgi:hypothetical protein
MHKWIGKLVLILLFSAIISSTYVKQAVIRPESLIGNQSTFQTPPNQGLRFLLPSAIAFVLPPESFDEIQDKSRQLKEASQDKSQFFVNMSRELRAPLHAILSYDTILFRLAFAFFSIALCFAVIQRFRQRVLNDNHVALDPVLPLALCLILLCHYCLSRRLNVYYVYDLPAILFYMLSFLLLTSRNSRAIISGIFFTVLFSMNRETIVVAPFHAAAFVLGRDWPNLRLSLTRTLTPIVSTLVIIVLLRILLAYSIYGVGLLGTIDTHEDETTLRFLSNAQHIINDPGYTFQLVLFGAGAVIWLPLSFPYIGNQLKLMLLFSIPAFLMLFLAGNFVELRIYNEFVPLLTVLLSQTSTYFFNNSWEQRTGDDANQ